MNVPVMEVKGVSKFYGQVMGLNDISLEIRPGMTGLLGPNGAGKSTLIKLATGQLKPSKGTVKVLGMSPWNDPALNARMGYCPEQDSFFPGMTGLQFVTFSARLLGYSKADAEAMAIKAIQRVDLMDSMRRSVQGYSKGMRQRIKLAQSIVHDPELLILDEPLTGTDPINRVKLMELMSGLIKDGKHILLSSHILHEVERLTENIVLINKGKLVAMGNIHAIRDTMDRFPLTVRIVTKDPRELGSLLVGLGSVSSMTFGADKGELLVRTPDPNSFHRLLQDVIVDHDIPVYSLDSPDDNLNAIFEYLVD